VYTSTEDDPVLIGAAMLAASAAKHHLTALRDVVTTMASKARAVCPSTHLKSYHDRKYMVYLEMLRNQQTYKNIMTRKNVFSE